MIFKSVERIIEVIKGSLHEAHENETLKAELKFLDHELKENHRRTRVMGNMILNQNGQLKNLEQYGRRNNVRINGIPERSEDETAEDTTKKVVEVLNSNIQDLNLAPAM